MDIIKEVRKIMIEDDKNQSFLAASTGLTQQQISHILLKRRKLKIELLQKMLDALGYELKIVKKGE